MTLSFTDPFTDPFTFMVSWFNLCRVCQDLEEQMLLASQLDEDDRTLHRALLSTALASGEGLLLECSDADSLKP